MTIPIKFVIRWIQQIKQKINDVYFPSSDVLTTCSLFNVNGKSSLTQISILFLKDKYGMLFISYGL